jgi:hypothetical protein
MTEYSTWSASRSSWLVLVACVLTGCAEPEPASAPPVLAAVSRQVARYPTTPAATIEEVIARLDEIIELAQARGDRIGYFATLYRQVTFQVWRGIQRGVFDGPRMNRFDTVFGNRYFAALEAWQSGGRPPECWREAFERTRDDDTVIAQHLFLGVNAHIGLDLPIAAAQVAPGQSIYALQPDYDRVNDIMAVAIDAMGTALAEVSPDVGLVDELAGSVDEGLFGFGVLAVRGEAWQNAVAYAQAAAKLRHVFDFWLDVNTAAVGDLISHPVPPLDQIVLLTRETEVQDPSIVIERLNAALR